MYTSLKSRISLKEFSVFIRAEVKLKNMRNKSTSIRPSRSSGEIISALVLEGFLLTGIYANRE